MTAGFWRAEDFQGPVPVTELQVPGSLQNLPTPRGFLQNTLQSSTFFSPYKVIYLENPDKFNCLKFEIKQRGTWEGYQGKRVEEMKSGQRDMNPWHYVLDTTSQNTIAGVSLEGNI